MKHKILLLLFLFSLLPSWGWGQETVDPVTINLENEEHKGGYTINSKGTYIFTGTYRGKPTQDIGDEKKAVINVAAGLDLEVTIILSEVEIDLSGSGGCPLSAKDAKMVNLKLISSNILKAGRESPGIWAPEGENCGIIINEKSGSSGSLIVGTSSNDYPGIGWGGNPFKNSYINIRGGIIQVTALYGVGIGNFMNPNVTGGKITITGGTVVVTSAEGSGIGVSNSKISITGGTVIATSKSGAGIGSVSYGSGCEITITGGIVNATSSTGAGIGSGQNGSGCEITITGGTVTATSQSGAGIGDGENVSGSTFSTGENGNAFINASSISDPSYKASGAKTKGLIFDGNDGAIYGESYTLTTDAIIENGKTLTITKDQTLTIAEGATLTIAQGATLTNKGTIKCDGKINGTISGDKKVQYAVTYDPNYDNEIPTTKYVDANTSPSYSIEREFYKFAGWFTQSEDGDQVETIKEAITVYAHWKPIDFIEDAKQIIAKTYGNDSDNEINFDRFFLNTDKVGGIKSIELKHTADNKFKNLSFKYSNPNDTYKGILKGIPIYIGTININFIITAYNGATTEVSLGCTVARADLTIAPGEPITKVYDGKNTVTTPNALKLVGVYSDDDVYLNPYTLTYDDVNAGTKKKITLSGKYALAGEKKDCYNLIIPSDFALTGTITQAPLTITPKSNQKLFEDEAPAYEVIGEVNNEKPEFNGSLGVERGKVVINSLALTTEFAQNYSLSLTPDIPITIINNETAKSLVQLNGTTNANGAYIDEVTVTAPEGFLIALESSSLKSSLVYTKSFMWNQKGTYDLNYKLKRISNGKESNDFSMEITVVESHYIPDNGGNDNNDSSITEYNIEIPEVEGISIDEGFGDHWIKDWKDFSFIITVKEGYVENSDPEVTIKGYDFKFDALTDTTYECRIDHVFKNAKVTITGIVKDPPATANNAIKAPEESWKIMNGVAYITVAKPTIFKVVEINGNITIYNLSPGVTPIYNLPKANVLLFSFDGKKAEKVIISNR